MNIDEDRFSHIRARLGMDRADILVNIQSKLDEWYPGQTRALKLHQGVLTLITQNSSIASELHFRQREIIRTFSNEKAAHIIERLRITIGNLK